MIYENVFIWIVTGLFAGWLARLAMRSHRDYGVVGDLVTGSLGALLGGWLLRQMGVLTPPNILGHILVALTGAALLLMLIRILRSFIAAVGLAPESALSEGGGDLDALLRQATGFDSNLITKFLHGKHTSRDVNQAFTAQLTIGERIADRVAMFGGSWTFIGMFFSTLIIWMTVNEDIRNPFDPYPFILLNLVLSCVAAIQAPVIMMSQNRQAEKDRLAARNNFEVNLRAEMEIMALRDRLEKFQQNDFVELVHSINEQRAMLVAIEEQINHPQR